jgi:hypothetical protein
MKRLMFIAVLAVAALSLAATAGASPGPGNGSGRQACVASGPALVNVHFTMINDFDSGVAGNAWANDTITRQLQIWQVGADTYCASVSDQGSFVTIAGASPGGASTVSAGIAGKIKGGYTTTLLTGTFSANIAVRGNLGTFDLGCTTAYDCTGDHPSYTSYGLSGDLAAWGWVYQTQSNGIWVNASTGNSGDITG